MDFLDISVLNLLHYFNTLLMKESASNGQTISGLALSIKAASQISQEQNPGLVRKYFCYVQARGV